MICDVCLDGRHLRCRGGSGGCECGMCRLGRERKEASRQEALDRARECEARRQRIERGEAVQRREAALKVTTQHAMVPDLYSMGLPYEDIVELLGIVTKNPIATVRRIMKRHEQAHAAA